MPGDSELDGGTCQGPPRRERALAFAKAHWHVLMLVAVMAAAFFLRMYYLSRHTEYTADSYYFLILARSIRDTFTYTVRGVAHTKYLPGYPIFIWLGGFLTGGLERSANLLAVLGATMTVWATYGIGRELFDRWAGLAAAFVVAFQPTFLKWTVLPMTEGLFTLLFALGTWLALTGCKRASPARRALAAMAGGLCFLVRWEGLLFLPLLALILVAYYRGSGFRPWEPAVMLLAFGLPMGVYVVRNIIVTGKITSYVGEFKEYSMEVTFPVLKHRAKVYVWNGMSDALFSALFMLGSLWLLLRGKWKPFGVAVGWFALFAGFHLFWYYAYERFMAPAVPAVALVIGFMFVDLLALSRAFFSPGGAFARRVLRVPGGARAGGDGSPTLSTAAVDEVHRPGTAGADPEGAPGPGSRLERRAGRLTPARRSALKALRAACAVILAVLFALMTWHGLARADRVIAENYKAFSDDHGGVSGMKKAAGWLEENAPGQLVAVDAGPMFTWLYYPGDVLLMRPVPWDLPVEQADIAYRDVPRRLSERGVRYLVVSETDRDIAGALKLYGITETDLPYLREAARWSTHYDYPDPHDQAVVIFEVLPPG